MGVVRPIHIRLPVPQKPLPMRSSRIVGVGQTAQQQAFNNVADGAPDRPAPPQRGVRRGGSECKSNGSIAQFFSHSAISSLYNRAEGGSADSEPSAYAAAYDGKEVHNVARTLALPMP
jgi:hypothetical protein